MYINNAEDRWPWFSTHPWANVTGSGHVVQAVEEECPVSSVETIETVKKGHVVGLYHSIYNLTDITNSILTLEVKKKQPKTQ